MRNGKSSRNVNSLGGRHTKSYSLERPYRVLVSHECHNLEPILIQSDWQANTQIQDIDLDTAALQHMEEGSAKREQLQRFEGRISQIIVKAIKGPLRDIVQQEIRAAFGDTLRGRNGEGTSVSANVDTPSFVCPYRHSAETSRQLPDCEIMSTLGPIEQISQAGEAKEVASLETVRPNANLNEDIQADYDCACACHALADQPSDGLQNWRHPNEAMSTSSRLEGCPECWDNHLSLDFRLDDWIHTTT